MHLDVDRTAFFLDFDGTLAPIVERPDAARLAPPTRAALSRLAARAKGALAVISGRGLDDLDALLAPLRLPASGSHGAERRDAAGRLHRRPGAAAALSDIRPRFTAFAARYDLLLEDKPAGLALHFRARPELEHEARTLADALADEAALRVVHGHMVAELVPRGTDKGAALRAFMAEPPFAGRLPLAVGDDVTDEDAIVAAQAMGGFGARIGTSETAAQHRFETIDHFLDWLHAQA